MNLAISIPTGDLSSSFIEKVRQIFGHKKVVLLPEKDYKEILKAKRNAEYLTKLDSSFKQIEEGKKVAFTVEELEAMAKCYQLGLWEEAIKERKELVEWP